MADSPEAPSFADYCNFTRQTIALSAAKLVFDILAMSSVPNTACTLQKSQPELVLPR
ncbi:MAG: hypothetical protein KDA81_03310 [Planctomycetaceae bacterium]|nr:hypothetical protein [Planctomycetaceae bacterium]